MGKNKDFIDTKIRWKDIKEAVAIISVGVAFLTFILRGMWYFYYTGYFRVFNIDKCYLVVNTDNTLYSIIGLLGIAVIWFVLNFIFYEFWKNREYKNLFVTILIETFEV
ncbi:MAG: hypothetical protein IKW30_01315 [Lachnospiraceae bacterium]|nr:hypothetical protein [Lachnospiraceae bacterium]